MPDYFQGPPHLYSLDFHLLNTENTGKAISTHDFLVNLVHGIAFIGYSLVGADPMNTEKQKQKRWYNSSGRVVQNFNLDFQLSLALTKPSFGKKPGFLMLGSCSMEDFSEAWIVEGKTCYLLELNHLDPISFRQSLRSFFSP